MSAKFTKNTKHNMSNDLFNSNQLMVWSDVRNDVIYMKNLTGIGLVTELVTTDIASVGEWHTLGSINTGPSNFLADDLAIDWIGNNLYWTDSLWSRIEVMNLDTRYRMELLHSSPNFNPRAIDVDPING